MSQNGSAIARVEVAVANFTQEFMTILIRQAASMRKEDLDQLGPVKVPLSSPVSQLTGRKYIDEIPGIDSMGIWECSPGRWQRTIMEEEFAHFIVGSARFIPEEGDPIDIRAGDTIWFPANSKGVWEITEDVRKVYVIIDRPGVFKQAKIWLKETFGRWLRISVPSASRSPVKTTQPSAAPALAHRAHELARNR
jgi:uncharacterized cupin superfamily protein